MNWGELNVFSPAYILELFLLPSRICLLRLWLHFASSSLRWGGEWINFHRYSDSEFLNVWTNFRAFHASGYSCCVPNMLYESANKTLFCLFFVNPIAAIVNVLWLWGLTVGLDTWYFDRSPPLLRTLAKQVEDDQRTKKYGIQGQTKTTKFTLVFPIIYRSCCVCTASWVDVLFVSLHILSAQLYFHRPFIVCL